MRSTISVSFSKSSPHCLSHSAPVFVHMINVLMTIAVCLYVFSTSRIECCTYRIFRTMLFEHCTYACCKKRYETGKIVVCLRTDTINSADARNISRIMTTPPNVTANDTYYIELVDCELLHCWIAIDWIDWIGTFCHTPTFY